MFKTGAGLRCQARTKNFLSGAWMIIHRPRLPLFNSRHPLINNLRGCSTLRWSRFLGLQIRGQVFELLGIDQIKSGFVMNLPSLLAVGPPKTNHPPLPIRFARGSARRVVMFRSESGPHTSSFIRRQQQRAECRNCIRRRLRNKRESYKAADPVWSAEVGRGNGRLSSGILAP